MLASIPLNIIWIFLMGPLRGCCFFQLEIYIKIDGADDVIVHCSLANVLCNPPLVHLCDLQQARIHLCTTKWSWIIECWTL